MEPVRIFRKEYYFLSNFYPAEVFYDGLLFKSSEAAFQAAKCKDQQKRREFTELGAKEAKKLGSTVMLREDWNEVKVPVMKEIVRAKFEQNEDLGRLLLETGDRLLEEGNYWKDYFWGVDLGTRQGQNHLGKILMEVRDELKSKKQDQ